jgi:hypothetical protein
LAFAKGGYIPKLSSDRMPERIACRQVSENSRTFPPFEKGGSGGISIVRNSLNPPGPLCERGRYFWGLRKGEIFLGFAKGGDIPKLFSDRMPERIACRQVSENSRTFPPFEKGGSGGISIVRNSLNPPGPLCKRGRYFWPLRKGDIFRSYLRIACRQGLHAGKYPKTAEHSPPLKKGGQGGFPIVRNSLNPPGPLCQRGRYSGFPSAYR